MISLDALTACLQHYHPRRLPGRKWVARCGVILLIAEHGVDGDNSGPALLLMRRAERAGDPWSGHVSFPGGRVDHLDASTRDAALRELQEETAPWWSPPMFTERPARWRWQPLAFNL